MLRKECTIYMHKGSTNHIVDPLFVFRDSGYLSNSTHSWLSNAQFFTPPSLLVWLRLLCLLLGSCLCCSLLSCYGCALSVSVDNDILLTYGDSLVNNLVTLLKGS